MKKLIVIEGTDCSGKNTQSKLLKERLENDGEKVVIVSFPVYDSPTGKIVGGPYLGKPSISECWFKEGANNVPPKVASLYYAADRLYNLEMINNYLEKDYIVILDRYTTSNMAHQAGKIKNKEERIKTFKWIETLEYDLLELPRPDIKIFLHMPYKYTKMLQNNRSELDELEKSMDNLINAENAYLEMTELYDFTKIECVQDGNLKDITAISNEVYEIVKNMLESSK